MGQFLHKKIMQFEYPCKQRSVKNKNKQNCLKKSKHLNQNQTVYIFQPKRNCFYQLDITKKIILKAYDFIKHLQNKRFDIYYNFYSMNIQMIFCRYCGGRSEKQYLFLTCKHLSCLSCAFLRTDFVTQELQCCGEPTKIDDQAMETIIRSKRFLRHSDNKQHRITTIVENIRNVKQQKENQVVKGKKQNNLNFQQGFKAMKKDKQNIKVQDQKQVTNAKTQQTKADSGEMDTDLPEISKLSAKIENSDFKREMTQYRPEIQQEDQFELQNLLMKHLQKAKRYFQIERLALRQRQQATLKSLISTFEAQKNAIEKPISQAVLQKFSQALDKKVPYASGNTSIQLTDDRSIRQSRQSYDHILKRLQLNQQRMKEKIQKHLEVLY